MSHSDFDHRLAQYADVLVRVGLNLRPGQRLLIGGGSSFNTGTALEALPLVRAVTEKAYQAGARYVEVIWEDPPLILTRLAHAPRDSFDELPGWQHTIAEQYGRQGDAVLALGLPDPDLLSGQEPELVNRLQNALFRHARPLMQIIEQNGTNWAVGGVPTVAWAARVLPDVPESERMATLWSLLFDLCRVTGPDPVAGWQAHVTGLSARAAALNRKQYRTLQYRGPGTDLKVGLPEGHLWCSAGMTAANGIAFTANIPTEEVFTLAHKDRVDGVVTATLPLSVSGALVENFRLAFEDGRVVRAQAERGGEFLDALLATDAGARMVGEVALVPHSSPIAQSGRIFYNILFDENASSHIALGNAYKFTLAGGKTMNDADFQAAGGNQSLIHVDFMVGSGEMEVDGILPDGRVEPVMRGGEWAFDV